MSQVIPELFPIPGWQHYFISTCCQVWSDMPRRNQVGPIPTAMHKMTHRIDRNGYVYFQFRKNHDGKHYVKFLHHLMLETFVGPCPPGLEACHFPDRSPSNNSISNLRWDTRKANHADKLIHGTDNRGTKHHKAKLSEDDVHAIRSSLESRLALAERYGVSRQHISAIRSRRFWSWLP